MSAMDDLIAYVRAQLDAKEREAAEFLARGTRQLIAERLYREQLADIAAKRAILDQYEGALLMAEDDPHDETRSADESTLRFVVRLLAQPYAGREGWRGEWAA